MRIKFKITDHIFKLAGAAAGFLSLGVFGLVFGLIGGALIDQLLVILLRNAGIRSFIRNKKISGVQAASLSSGLLIETAAMTVVWYLCRKDSARSEIAAEAAIEFFPDLPRNIADLLREAPDIDYEGTAGYFGTNASDEQKAKLSELVRSCGLEIAAIRAVAGNENEEASRILSAAGFKISRQGSESDYMLLGIDPGADSDEIKRVYHKLAADFHPDGGGDLTAEQQKITEDAFKRIQAAYERLTKK